MKKIILKNGMELMIRKPEESDASKLSAYKSIIGGESDFLTFGSGDIEFTADKELKALNDINSRNNSIMLLALINNEAAGLAVFRGGDKTRIMHTGELGISVRKSFWGMGIGTELMESLIEWAAGTGIIRKINLRVRTDNYNAINLYKKCGFKEEGIISREFLINNKFYDTTSMGLLID